jgi:hypothetical protein
VDLPAFLLSAIVAFPECVSLTLPCDYFRISSHRDEHASLKLFFYAHRYGGNKTAQAYTTTAICS